MATTSGTLGPSFEPLDGAAGLEIVDPIERLRYVLRTPEPVTPTPVSGERFRSPIDAAVAIRTAAVILPSVVLAHVRDESGAVRAEAEHFADESFPEGVYTIELNAPIKLYLRVHGPCRITADAEHTRIEFGDESDVLVGARSYHKHPATTITTTGDPTDLMTTVGAFSSALKTTSPERSYPTLRGHPPTVELGDELHVPDGLTPVESGVTIELPPTHRAVYLAAPLAYYLGAELVPGENALLRTETGFEYPLQADDGFEHEIERLLKQTFFLDCLTRTEGAFGFDLYERRAVEAHPEFDLDFTRVYGLSLAEQVESYLDVPFEILEPHLPQWKLTAYVEPTPESAEFLPFLVNDLAAVRTTHAEDITVAPEQVIGSFTRMPRSSSRPVTESPPPDGDELDTRTDDTGARGGDAELRDTLYVRPPPTDSLESAWVGKGIPLGASKAMIEAYQNRLDRPPNEEDITITVVCNDPVMAEERGVVNQTYGSRADLPFDVTVERDLTTAELREVIATRTEFFHYIGHVDDEGFECADGRLDATTLDTVGVDTFLLNACWSYEQGMALIRKGAIGGIVTLTDVINVGAIQMGKTLARLLNAGFPLGAALEIARGQSIVGKEYIVVGDSGVSLTQPEGYFPNLCDITRDEISFKLGYRTYPTSQYGLGGVVIPLIGERSIHHLSSGVVNLEGISKTKLEQFFDLEDAPVKINGRLRWSSDVDISDF